MRVAVCDDDEREIDHLSELFREYQVSRGMCLDCHFFHNSIDFLSDMKSGDYDLVFLDMVMPGINGIEAARELREKDKNVKLIFISLSPEFAMASYSVEAYHYLLKPVVPNTLFPLLDKALKELPVQQEQGLVLKMREEIVRLSFTEIEFLEVINKKVSFHLTDGTVREVTSALADLEGRLLARPEFVKTHRSYIINLSCVQSVGLNCARTKNGHSIPISRQRHSQIQNAYMNFLNQIIPSAASSDQPPAPSSKEESNNGLWRILLVDDDPADRAFWTDILRSHGCVVQSAKNGEDALKLVTDETYNCILLDLMIPGENGFSICERLCQLTHAPVIFLSCVTEPGRQIQGFAAGGIDYITKDTSAELFWAKVETRIRLTASERTQFWYGPLLLDLTGRKVLINGKELFLTSIEFDILWLLSKHSNHVFTPKEIFGMIWDGQPWDDGKLVQTHMSRLRRKLEKAWEEHHFIEAVWGQGYRFVP